MTEPDRTITLTITRPKPGEPETPPQVQVEGADDLTSARVAMHALARHAIALRRQRGKEVPDALVALAEATEETRQREREGA